MRPLRHWIPELVNHLLETCLCLARLLLFKWCVCINFQQFDLFVDVVDGLLKVALFSVGGETQGLKWRKSSHQLLI